MPGYYDDMGAAKRPVRRAANGSMKQIAQQYSVFREGFEVVSRVLYDYQTYAQAGQTSLTFFQNPVGQSSKTLADTNLTLPGQISANQQFLCNCIEVDFMPGNVASRTGAVVADNFNDQKKVGESGYLQFYIGTKEYYTGAPLKHFPTNTATVGTGALSDTTTAAASRVTVIDMPFNAGKLCKIKPVMIPPNETFNVTLIWPTAVAVSVAGRIGVRLNGNLYRRSQ